MRNLLYKFGGTSVGDADRIRSAAALVTEAATEARVCVVSSAMSGVTNLLVELASDGYPDDRRDATTKTLREKHEETARALGISADDPASVTLRQLLDEIETLSAGMALTRIGSRRMRDRLVAGGERLAVELLAWACRSLGTDTVALHADAFLETGDGFSETEPRSYTHDRRTRAALMRVLDRGVVPVVTGFTGRGPDGDTRLLGRGGSDLSATLFAAALQADECVIWTDVPGVSTCDPRLVPDAEPIDHLHYREAGEMAYFGSKVLHPRTMIPVSSRQIPVTVRSTLDPQGTFTRIDGSLGGRSGAPAAVSVLKSMGLLSVEGAGLAGVAGVSARLFTALAGAGISVAMISQGSAESSICLGLRSQDIESAEAALREAFRLDIARGAVEDITIRPRVGILTVVTAGMRHRVGAAARMTGALSRAGVNVLAVAQGSSELSVSFAIDEDQLRSAARALHESMRDAGNGTDLATQRLTVALAGVGLVGRAVARGIDRLDALRLMYACDRRACVREDRAFASDAVDLLCAHKQGGQPFHALEGAIESERPAEHMVEMMVASGAPNPVLVDCTADPMMVEVVEQALRAGIDVVTANKEILACDSARYASLHRAAGESGAHLMGEATVGAGLPVACTIASMREAGDTITRVSASLSGTIGYLLGGLRDGHALDELVERAIVAGFAEPDPSADLLGDDMRRKAIILARLAGCPDTPARVEPFADVTGLASGSPEFAQRVRETGDAVLEKARAAEMNGMELRYLLELSTDAPPHVGFVPCAPDGPFGGMTAQQARIVIHSSYNDTRPLIITGPGAGDVTTAGGVLADLARLVRMRAVGGVL